MLQIDVDDMRSLGSLSLAYYLSFCLFCAKMNFFLENFYVQWKLRTLAK